MKRILIVTAALAALAACAPKEVSFETLESARLQAKENAEFNARKWRADTKLYENAAMVARGDSTQSPKCPQGDGWASIDLVDSTNGKKLTGLKCSTVSLSVGCRVDADFKTSPYASDDGSCQPTEKVPHPLPKLAK